MKKSLSHSLFLSSSPFIDYPMENKLSLSLQWISTCMCVYKEGYDLVKFHLKRERASEWEDEQYLAHELLYYDTYKKFYLEICVVDRIHFIFPFWFMFVFIKPLLYVYICILYPWLRSAIFWIQCISCASHIATTLTVVIGVATCKETGEIWLLVNAQWNMILRIKWQGKLAFSHFFTSFSFSYSFFCVAS